MEKYSRRNIRKALKELKRKEAETRGGGGRGWLGRAGSRQLSTRNPVATARARTHARERASERASEQADRYIEKHFYRTNKYAGKFKGGGGGRIKKENKNKKKKIQN